jgi:hypothetical protein
MFFCDRMVIGTSEDSWASRAGLPPAGAGLGGPGARAGVELGKRIYLRKKSHFSRTFLLLFWFADSIKLAFPAKQGIRG